MCEVSENHNDHTRESSAYAARAHGDGVLLDIGEGVGALVLYTRPELVGQEVEISPIGADTHRVHTAILERRIADKAVFAGVYPELRAGKYRLWSDDPGLVNEVTIVGGKVAEVDWR